MDPIVEIARRHGVAVIEDAAQAHGADYRGRRCGSLGDMAAFSFYPGKNLGAYGEGGAAVTSDPALARTLRMLRDWGAEKKYEHRLKGYNYRMEGLQGAILGVKLRHLETWTEARRARAALYDDLLEGVDVQRPYVRPDVRHVFHVYTIRTPDRDRYAEALKADGIATGIHYPVPVHLQPAYADLGYGPGSFPQSELAAREVLSLPLFPEMSDSQVRAVAAAIRGVGAAAAHA
jgi:dTDP-4-amino-4,6-dideoxygalactose transaminase